MYVVGALEYERPFLAPLYKFMALHPRGSVRKVPAYIFLSRSPPSRSKSAGTTLAQLSRGRPLSRRVDAPASEGSTGHGADENGTPDPLV